MAHQPQQRKGQKVKDQKWNVEVIEYIDGTGRVILYEHYEGTVALSDINHGSQYKLPCEGCPKYGKNLSCPPYSPSFLQYIQGAKRVKVVCMRIPTTYFGQPLGKEAYHSCFRMARGLLVNELLKHREAGHPVAGSGACLACEICAVEDGGQSCKKPAERIYSLESLGVNVISLVKRCFDIDLTWSGSEYAADFVSAVGAVFLP